MHKYKAQMRDSVRKWLGCATLIGQPNHLQQINELIAASRLLSRYGRVLIFITLAVLRRSVERMAELIFTA